VVGTPVFEIDPLKDPRWTSFLDSHPQSSIFHTKEWLEALRRTYGYTPRAFTTSPGGTDLSDGIVFCQVDRRLTGSRLVSLPFSDHCEPLLQHRQDLHPLLSTIGKLAADRFRYMEIRPRVVTPATECNWVTKDQYCFHLLDLRPNIQELYTHLHKDGMQRKIRRAERERVVLDQGLSDVLVREFYQLLLLTRRRHRVPPQPLAWFRNLVDCLGPRLTIRVARVDGRPIASILTVRHKKTVVYKYGCSDHRFHPLGAMPRLFWQALQESKSEQLEMFDLGRSENTNPGLIRFKDHLGAAKTSIRYWQYPGGGSARTEGLNSTLYSSAIRKLLPHLPDSLFRLAGEFFYRYAA
jgi:CelD/BcsL family acetyltransferase involved in cellulose biosynthesis